MSFIRILIAMSAVALTAGCSSDFSGGEAGFGGGATAKKTPSKEDPLTVECDSKIQACSNGKPVDPGTTSFPPGLDTSLGGVVARNVRSVFFSGNGPGSCGGLSACVGTPETSWAGPQKLACPAPSTQLPMGAQGDCFENTTTWKTAGQSAQTPVVWQWGSDVRICQGNRTICAETGVSAAALTTNLKISPAPCSQSAMLDAGPANENFHILGIAESLGYSKKYLCRNVIAAKDIKNGTMLVTALEFRRLKTDTRSPTAPGCDAANGWELVADLPDCMAARTFSGNPLLDDAAKKGLCSGLVSVCQKKEKVSF